MNLQNSRDLLVRQQYYTGAGRRRLRFSFLLIARMALGSETAGDVIASLARALEHGLPARTWTEVWAARPPPRPVAQLVRAHA